MKISRDSLGRLVRQAWVEYCVEIHDAKPSHLMPYDSLSEQDKEADRRIGEAVYRAAIKNVIDYLDEFKRKEMQSEDNH